MKTTNLALFAAICMVISGGGVEAETFTWTGAANDGNKWSTPENWENNAAPSAKTDTVVFNIESDLETDFDLSVSPIIQKYGGGKLTLGGSKKYNNTNAASSSPATLFLYGGTLDLGGGQGCFRDPADGSFAIAAGSTLLNGKYHYRSLYKIGSETIFNFKEGIITIGKGATVDMPWELKFSYGTATTECGNRTLAIRGGTVLANSFGTRICGANTDAETTPANDGTTAAAVLDVSEGGTLESTATIMLGSVNDNKNPVCGAASIIRVTDSTIKMSEMKLLYENANSSFPVGRSYALFHMMRSTLTSALTSEKDSFDIRANDAGNSLLQTSFGRVILTDSTATIWRIKANAAEYTGSLTDVPTCDGVKLTGVFSLDGSTLIPKGAMDKFIYNGLSYSTASASKAMAKPCVELLSSGGIIDTEYDVTIPAVAFGVGGWTKKGSGALTLSGANLYTGDTKCEAGAIQVTGSLAGGAVVSDGEFLVANGASVAGGVAVTGGTFSDESGQAFPAVSINGGTASFSVATTISSLSVGANGGTLALGAKGFIVNNVSGTANLANLVLDATPDAWGVDEAVLTSDSPEFLEWAKGKIGEKLSGTLSAKIYGTSIVIESSVAAKTTTWTGNGADASWATAENWDEGAPNPGDTVILDGTTQTANTLSSALAVPTLTFAENAGSFTVGGAGALTIGSALTNKSANAQTLNVPVSSSATELPIHAVGDLSLCSSLSAPKVVKTGAGVLSLAETYSGKLEIAEGGVALASTATLSADEGAVVVGGGLDLGGGSLTLNQPDSEDPILLDGATLKNGNFTFSTKQLRSFNAASRAFLPLTNGTLKVSGSGTVFDIGAAGLFSFSEYAAGCGPRTLLVEDGATLKSTQIFSVVGPSSSVATDYNDGTVNPATLELRNATYIGDAHMFVGAYSLNGYNTRNDAGIFKATDSTVSIAGNLVVGSEAYGTGGSYGLAHLVRSTWVDTRTGLNTGSASVQINTMKNGSHLNSMFRIVLEDSTMTVWCIRIDAPADAYTGPVAGVTRTGILVLDKGTLVSKGGAFKEGANEQFLWNDRDKTVPCVELLSGGGAVDSNGHDIAIPAVIFGEGGLTKKGTGTLTLSGDNLYEGGTVIEEGTLNVTGSVKGGVTVKSGGTLSCASDAVFESVTIEKGGKVAVPETYEGEWAEILRTTGEITVLDDMATNGLRLFVRRSNGQNVLCWGKRPGFMVILY